VLMLINGCAGGSEAMPLRFVAVLICLGCLGNNELRLELLG